MNIFSWTFAYDFLRGPMTWIAAAVFVFGTVYQIYQIFSQLKKQDIIKFTPGPGNLIKPKTGPKEKTDWLLKLKLSIAGVNPFMTVLTIIFHFMLVIPPFFVLGHNILLDNAFGTSFISLPEALSDALAFIVIICAGVFLYRRLFLERVRIITTSGDYLFLFLAAAPFITGFLAYHQIFLSYKIMISLHILSGELMLMAVPFTKFAHMIYFVVIRFLAMSEYGLGKGVRTW